MHTRRNIIKAAAWATPAVVAVSASPAFASSSTCPRVLVKRVDVKKERGHKTYKVRVSLRSGTLSDIKVEINGVPLVLGADGWFVSTTPIKGSRLYLTVTTLCDKKVVWCKEIGC